jgi:hypothetical protein
MENHDPSTGRPRRQFRKLLIYPQFQIPLVGLNLAAIGVSLLVFWVAAQNTLRDLQPAGALSGIDIDFYRRFLEYQSSQFRNMFLSATAVSVAFSTLVTLFLSHRIAGPMVRLRSYFHALKDGADPIPQLAFRDRDFLGDIPPLVNEAIAALVARLAPPKGQGEAGEMKKSA